MLRFRAWRAFYLLLLGPIAACAAGEPTGQPPVATQLVLTRDRDTLVSLGETVGISAVARDANGTILTDVAIAWASTDQSVATVDAQGTVTAVANGTARIVGSVGHVTDTCWVTVDQRPTALTVTAPVGEARTGNPLTITVTVVDALGTAVAGTAVPITLTLDPNGYGAALAGTLVRTTVDGEAPFDGLTIDRGGQAFRLDATSGALVGRSDPFDVLLHFASVSLDGGIACGLTTSGDAYCWGRNRTGGLGSGVADGLVARPRLVAGNLRFIQVDAGGGTNENGVYDGFACGLVTSGAAYCWGRNVFGQLGNGTTSDALEPVPVSGGLTFTRLAAGRDHVCALAISGTIHCWGRNSIGELGNDDMGNNSSVPVPVAGARTYRTVFVEGSTSCGHAINDTLYCWVSTTGLSGSILTVPTAVNTSLEFAALSPAMYTHFCGVDAPGVGYCWGQDHVGELGSGTPGQNEASPTVVTGGHQWSFIGASGRATCGLRTDGVVLCWGFENVGRLGQGLSRSFPAPTVVQGAPRFTRVAVGTMTMCGLTAIGDVYCWGWGGDGDRGDGTLTHVQTVPVRVVAP